MILITLLIQLAAAFECTVPAETACLVRNAQYTILGTVVDNSVGRGNDTSKGYDASIAVQCVWSSFVPGNVPGNGWGLADSIITVKGWGKPLPGCPNGGGADATSGTTQIFFVYITQGELGSKSAIYAVADRCQGGIPYNNDNVQTIANVLAGAPGNIKVLNIASRIPKANMGTNAQCMLPGSNGGSGTVVGSGTGTNYVSTSKPSLNLDPPKMSGSKRIISGLLRLIIMLM